MVHGTTADTIGVDSLTTCHCTDTQRTQEFGSDRREGSTDQYRNSNPRQVEEAPRDPSTERDSDYRRGHCTPVTRAKGTTSLGGPVAQCPSRNNPDLAPLVSHYSYDNERGKHPYQR